MGRITVFSEPDCPDSAQVRTALERRDIPFEEIDVAKYPERRSDMISLTNCLKTPQVFFNSEHVGSSEEARSLLVAWDTEAMFSGYSTSLERYQVEIASEEDPADDRLRLPLPSQDPENEWYPATNRNGDGTASEAESSNEASMYDFEVEEDQEIGGDNNDDDVFIPGQKAVSALTVTRDLVAHLPHSSHVSFRQPKGPGFSTQSMPKTALAPRLSLPRLYRRCFDGNDAVFTLMLLYDISSREEAVEVCKNLEKKRVIHSVFHDGRKTKAGRAEGSFNAPTQFEDARGKLFRLQPYQESDVLNSFRAYQVSKNEKDNLAVQNPIRFVNGLRRLLSAMIDSATDDRGRIEFDAIRKSAPFSAFEGGACKLRSVDMTIMTEKTRLAFVINIFNIMALHAIIRWDLGKIPRTFFDRVKYNIGGIVISLNNILHDILRGGNKQTRRRGKPIPKARKDIQRLALSMAFDPRIHFALSFGARSSPSVESTYTPESIEEELRVVTEINCSMKVEINEERSELVLPAIMGRYRRDFASNVSELPGVVLEYFRSKELQLKLERMMIQKPSIQVKFRDFDWRTNAAHVVSTRKFGLAASSMLPSRRPSSIIPTYAPTRGLEVESWPLTSKATSTSTGAPWDLSSLNEECPGKSNGDLDSLHSEPISAPKSKRNLRLSFRRRPDINQTRSTDNTEPTHKIYSNSFGMSSSIDSGDHQEFQTSPKPFDAKESMQSFIANFSQAANFVFMHEPEPEPEPELESTGSDEDLDADNINYAYSKDVYVVESREFDSFEHWKDHDVVPAAESLHLPMLESNIEAEDEDEEDEEESGNVNAEGFDPFFHTETDDGTFDLPFKVGDGDDFLACKQLWVGDFETDFSG